MLSRNAEIGKSDPALDLLLSVALLVMVPLFAFGDFLFEAGAARLGACADCIAACVGLANARAPEAGAKASTPSASTVSTATFAPMATATKDVHVITTARLAPASAAGAIDEAAVPTIHVEVKK